jgi:hypothetical protein
MLAPKDHWPLVKELKKLTLQEAIRLLRYCQSLYKMHGVAANVQLLKPHKGSRTPYLRCVVEWITALLDAHFTALVLAPECHALLKVSLSLSSLSLLPLFSLSLSRCLLAPKCCRCVCVSERGREGGRERERESARARERERECVCVD